MQRGSHFFVTRPQGLLFAGQSLLIQPFSPFDIASLEMLSSLQYRVFGRIGHRSLLVFLAALAHSGKYLDLIINLRRHNCYKIPSVG